MKYTKGPWRYEESTKTIRSPENYWLATMDSWDGAVDHTANAHLMAAAPEIIEACRLAIQALKNVRAAGETAYLPIIKQGERAINKAEGRE